MVTTTVGVSYKQHAVREDWDAIVIGSGIGGLATATLLARYGRKRVLVLERHYVAGGFTHAFHRPGYAWDVGVHYIGQVQSASSPLRAAFDNLTDGRLQWSPMPDVYDRVRIGDREYLFVSGRERFRQQLKSYFPSEADAIDNYLRSVQSCIRSRTSYFTEKALPGPVAFLAGPLLRVPFLRWARRTTAEELAAITTNGDLKAVLTAQWGDYGLPPSESSFAAHATIADHYFEGASYPVGGAPSIAASFAPTIESAGGHIALCAEVSQILLDRNQRACGVRMQDGREIRAGVVISDAGAWNTFSSLLPPEAPGASSALKELRRLPPSKAHLCLYVGARGGAAELGLTGTNLWVHPTPDHDANLSRFERDPCAPFPMLFVSSPSAKDPDFERRYPGHSTLEVITPVPYAWFKDWGDTRWKHRGQDYDEFKENLADRLRQSLEQHVPAVQGKIEIAELSTPLSTRHFMNYQRGEIYGVSASPERYRLRCLTPRTAIRNLYLTGQDVCMLGVAGALMGGVLAASAILRRNLMSVVTKPIQAGRVAA
ncbi:MAG TPA: NAD(P)/FAD-dependent oxidoreductase [Terriglobia bacterium]|nr:NAD(P)/FAD-dependent oxidoreductase [Terriglobia bacterium]